MNLNNSKLKTLIVPILFFLYFGLFFLLLAGIRLYWSFYLEPSEQPIAFSHRIHVLNMSLPCEQCHIYFSRSTRAGIPTVQTCMDCHSEIATEKPEIKKLLRYWQEKKPIPWIRIHSLPDFVHFSHKRHIKKGIDCSQCHGDIKAMKGARKVRSLKMGWCVNCHRSHSAPTDCTICHK